jgi:hypothetical protein
LTAVSQSTQYVTSSQLIVADNKIIVNVTDLQRFGGLSVIDSGSTSPATASIYWDSLNHNFIYENLSGSGYNSAIFIAGPQNYGPLGNEVGLTTNRIPVAVGSDHIDSRPQSSSIRIDFPSRLTHIEAGLVVTGSITAQGGLTGSILGTSSYSQNSNLLDGLDSTVFSTTGSNIFIGDQTITGSIRTTGSVTFTGTQNITGSLEVYSGSAKFWHNGTSFYTIFERTNELNTYTSAGGGSTLYIQYNSDAPLNVGKGALQVQGNNGSVVVGNGGGYSSAKLLITGSTPSQNLFRIQNNTATDLFLVSSSGNVGIGTITPQASLDIVSANNVTPFKVKSTGITGTGIVMSLLNGSDDLLLSVQGNGVTYIRGNVGIGTTTPQTKLDVRGGLAIGPSVDSIPTMDGGSFIGSTSGSGTYPFSEFGNLILASRTNGTGRDILFYTGTTLTSRMIVDRNGNVGIGLTSPSALLHVSGANNTTPVRVSIGNNATYNFSGNSTSGYITTFNMDDVGSSFGHNSSTRDLQLRTNSTARLTILGGGNVGIGTTSPGALLHVQGNVSASSYTSSINNAVGFFGTSSWAVSASVASGFAGTANRVLYNNASNVTTTSANLTFDGTNLTVGGQLNAATKSFLINHRTKPGKKLVYGVAEGPEHSVFIRGRLKGTNTIVLPNEWDWLVDLDSITVQLTPIGKPQKLYVKSIDRLYITVENGGFFSGPIDCYYFIQATRKDVDPLQTVV